MGGRASCQLPVPTPKYASDRRLTDADADTPIATADHFILVFTAANHCMF